MSTEAPTPSKDISTRAVPLYLNVLLIAVCGLVYELLAGTIASYLLGDSVTQFSFVIGLYLSAMGVGSWASGFLEKDLATRFVEVELSVALIGGFSAPLLFFGFASTSYFPVILYGTVFFVGALVGLEIPLLMRILKDKVEFRELVSRIFAVDYLGALFASVLFPIFFVPKLGLIRTSLIMGIANAAIGFWGSFLLESIIPKGLRRLRIIAISFLILLGLALWKADAITLLSEEQVYADPIVYSQSSPYQRIVVTRNRAGFQLFLNGNLQFSSADEYRYHEALVHPAMQSTPNPKRILVMGGGDGLALREIFRYPSIEHVTLVDLDPAMTGLSDRFAPLAKLNENSFHDKRLTVYNQDAMRWLEENPTQIFDVAIIDFPDPNNFSLGKLYTKRFYSLLKRHLAENGSVVVQTTSPLFARKSFWCVANTMRAAGFSVQPYHVTVPSFGVWGYTLAKQREFLPPRNTLPNLRYLNQDVMAQLFVFSEDLKEVATEINRLDNQVLVHYYEEEWKRWQ